MVVKALIVHSIISFSIAIAFVVANPNDESKPEFAFGWLEDKDNYIAGDTATIKIKILGNFDPHSNKFGFSPTVSVNGKGGNSTYISGLCFNFGGDTSSWTISFVPILVGVFNVLIADDRLAVLDSSLHFFVHPGKMHPAVSIASWMDYVNEFVAGTRALVLILPKDAYGNNVDSTDTELNSYIFNVSESYVNGSAANVLSVTSLGWSDHGHLRIEFIASSAGDLLLHVQRDNHTLRGSPLPFKVHPGPVDFSKCIAVWKFGTIVSQLFSKMEIFIHQLDLYGNLVPGSYLFDAEIVEKGTNLSIPVADMNFKELSPGIQILEFSALEPGNFWLIVYDAKHNRSISNMPYAFTVSIGYCDGLSSIVNGSGLNQSVAGEEARFTVYLRDKYQYPSPVEMRMLQVQIAEQTGSYTVLPMIYPLETLNGTKSPWHLSYDATSHLEVAPVPSVDQNNSSADSSQVLAHAYGIVFMPEKSGVYDILVLCGNIPLNGGHSFKKEVNPGEVNMSLSGVVEYAAKTQKLLKNEVIVRLMDTFSNPVLSQQSKLKLEIGSINHSDFMTWMFVDNNDGSYMGTYMVKDVGSYELCASLDGKHFEPCPFGVNVYSSEYFPKAYDDSITVWEDESVAFNPLGNDYFAGENTTVIGFSNPFHGTVLQNALLFRYTPYKGFYGNDSFSYTICDINGNTAAASVNISVLSIPPQFICMPTNLRASEDVLSPRFGGFHGIEITYPESLENISVSISASSGTVTLFPVMMQFWQPIWSEFGVNKDGKEGQALNLSGPVEVINRVLQSVQYFGDENFYGDDTIKVSARNKNGVTDLNVTIFVEPVNDSPFILTPEYIILEENDDANGSLIYEKGRRKFEFLIGDPDLLHFPGNKSDFKVSLSMEVTSGILEAILPMELINTTELKLRNSYLWQPLQTFVTISKHFVVKARGLRFQGTVDDCNIIVKQLKYYATSYGSVLTIVVNDMGNYGCYPDCAENVSKPLIAEANVNLIKRKPLSSRAAHALGFVIIVEFLGVLSLGVVLLFYSCKCAISLISERRSRHTMKDTDPVIQTSAEQLIQENVAEKPTTSTGCCSSPLLITTVPSNFHQRSWRQFGHGNSTKNGNQSQHGASTDFRSVSLKENRSAIL